MAVSTITYTNKVALNENTSVADINKVKAEDMNEIKSVVNNNASEISTNTQDIANITGTILWTNSSPTSNFTAQDINLSSSDYDVLEVYYTIGANTTDMMSQKVIKGYGTLLQCNIIANNNIYHRYRTFSRTNDTKYAVGSGYQQTTNSGTASQADSAICPIYVVGYKTGLFS